MTGAKDIRQWDLADPKAKKSHFTADSFYIVIDGVRIESVRQTAEIIKRTLVGDGTTRVRGPLCLPTKRRRYMVLREVRDGEQKGMYLSSPKRIRNVLLVLKPTSIGIAALISVPLPHSVNVRIEPYDMQYDLRDSQ